MNTLTTIKDLAAYSHLIEAAAHGKTIQINLGSPGGVKVWNDIDSKTATFAWPVSEYRIKPEPEPVVDPYAEVRAAFIAGKVIQWQSRITGKWATKHDLIFTGDPAHYRIKPEPVVDLYAELKAAHAAGKIIEFKPPGQSIWVEETPELPFYWCYPVVCYRIKPEPEPVVDSYAEVRKAFAAGKTIQLLQVSGWCDWPPETTPLFNGAPSSYRIKPEPKYRPYASPSEVPVGALIRSSPTDVSVIVQADSHRISYGRDRWCWLDRVPKGYEVSLDNGKTWVQAGVLIAE